MSDHSSAGSEGWTPDSPVPDTDTSSSAKPTDGAGRCSRPGGPECPSTTTYEVWQWRTREEGVSMEQVELPNLTRAAIGGTGGAKLWISSAEASPAKTSVLPENEPDSAATGPACSSSSRGSSTLFDPDGFSSRTYPVSSLHKAVGTSEQSLERWPTSGTAWAGGFSTHVSSECRSAAGVCSSSEPALTEILQPPHHVPAKYSLSARAAQGILRRAEKRGRILPAHLLSALSKAAEEPEATESTQKPLREAI